MLIVCRSDLSEAEFDRLARKLAAVPFDFKWSRRRDRLTVLVERALATEESLRPVIEDPAVEYVLRDPSEREIGRMFSRRDLLDISLGSTGLLAAAAVLAPVGVYLVAPPSERSPSGDILVARKDEIPVGESVSKVIDGEEYLIVRRDGDHYHALGATCTHSDVCTVQWRRERQQLVCPCHRGIFDIYGNVVSGPPPRPLPSREVVLREGDVYVKRAPR